MNRSSSKGVRPRPPLFRALGAQNPPAIVEVGGVTYSLVTVFKHDSWAATALYEADGRRVTCKFNRTQSVYGLPMRWLGRALARREADFLDRLADVAQVPDGLGPVRVDGRIAENAIARAFVEGEPWRDREGLAPDFMHQISQLLAELHRRGIAYVDLHKRENVVVDRHGRPHLIDFQVSLAVGDRFPRSSRAFGWLVALMQETDVYHLRKHHVRLFPEEFTPEELETYAQPPRIIGAHRRIARPLRHLRRRFLTVLGIRDGSGMAESEHEPEAAFRKDGAQGESGAR